MKTTIISVILLAALGLARTQSTNILGEGKDATIYRYEFDNFGEDGYRFA